MGYINTTPSKTAFDVLDVSLLSKINLINLFASYRGKPRLFEIEAVSDNFDERIEQKIFHAEIVVDNEQVKRETAGYKKLPQIIDFRDEDGNDRMQEEIQANYNRVKQEVQQIVTDEMERIKNDPDLQHLIKEE